MTVQATHNDIIRELAAASQQIEHLEVRMDKCEVAIQTVHDTVTRNGAMTADALELQREMRADIAAIRDKLMAMDLLRARIVGAFAAGSVALAALWWLVRDRVTLFFLGPQ